MIHIPSSQWQTLRQGARQQYLQRTLQHMRHHFPNHWRVAGAARLQALADLGVDRAAGHGFQRQADACQYLNLMLLLGADFDRDPLLPWAGQLLQQRRSECRARLDRVYDRALAFLNDSAGRRNEHLEAALRRALAHARSGWRPPPVPAAGFRPLVLNALRWVYPQRAQVAGEAALGSALQAAAQGAARHGLRSQPDALLYMGLAYMLGSGFAEDPQFGWAAQALQPQAGDAPGAAAQRLQQAALDTLADWLGA